MNGINIAIEIDSARELSIDKKSTNLISLFLLPSIWELVLFKMLNADILVFSILVLTIFNFIYIDFYFYNKAIYSSRLIEYHNKSIKIKKFKAY